FPAAWRYSFAADAHCLSFAAYALACPRRQSPPTALGLLQPWLPSDAPRPRPAPPPPRPGIAVLFHARVQPDGKNPAAPRPGMPAIGPPDSKSIWPRQSATASNPRPPIESVPREFPAALQTPCRPRG